MVPCPGSRRFWISHIGPTALEVDSLQFEKYLHAYVCDLLPGQVNQIVKGIMETLSKDRKVSLCDFGCLFGDVPISDALDTLANTGTANITYHLLMTPAAPWNPPTARKKRIPSPLRSEILLPEEVLDVVRPKLKDVCLNCVNYQTRIAELDAELEVHKRNPSVGESLPLSPQSAIDSTPLFVSHSSPPRSALKKQSQPSHSVSLVQLMSQNNNNNNNNNNPTQGYNDSISTPARGAGSSSFQEWLRDNVS